LDDTSEVVAGIIQQYINFDQESGSNIMDIEQSARVLSHLQREGTAVCKYVDMLYYIVVLVLI